MTDHTHLQLCFTRSTRDIPGSYFKPNLASISYSHFLLSKATSSNEQSLLGNTKACCHQVVEQVAKGSLVDKYAFMKKKVKGLFHFNYYSYSPCMITTFSGGNSSSQRMETSAEEKMSIEPTNCHCRLSVLLLKLSKAFLLPGSN